MKRILRWALALGLVAGLGIIGLVGAGIWFFQSPERVQELVAWSFREAEVEVHFDTCTLESTDEPWSWRLKLRGLSVKPHNPEAPRLELDATSFDVPGLLGVWAGRVDLGDVKIQGLRIDLPTRGPREHPVSLGRGPLLLADSITIEEASLDAPADDPLPAMRVVGLQANLVDFALRVGQGPLRGRGTVSADRYESGPVHVDDITVERVLIHGSGLDLLDAHFAIAGGQGSGKLTINLDSPRPEIIVVAGIDDVHLDALVRQAIAGQSPVFGTLAGTITVRAGGSLPRGGAVTHANIVINDARVPLGDRLGGGAKAVLKVLPWVTLQNNELVLGPTEGALSFRRGQVTVEHLVHRHKRDLEAWGELRRGKLDLTLHLRPRRGDAPGVGIVVTGSRGDLEVRRAKKGELVAPR